MRSLFRRSPKLRLLTPFLMLGLAGHSYAHAQGQPAVAPGDAQVARVVGSIKSVHPDSITLASDSGEPGDSRREPEFIAVRTIERPGRWPVLQFGVESEDRAAGFI